MGLAVASQRRAEGRGSAGDLGQPLLQQLGRPRDQCLLVGCPDRAFRQDVFLQGVEPAIDHVAKGTLRCVGRRESFHQPTIHGLQAVQRGFGLGDLDLGRGESQLPGTIGQPTCEEGLAAAVVAADRLEHTAAGGDLAQFLL